MKGKPRDAARLIRLIREVEDMATHRTADPTPTQGNHIKRITL